MVPSKDDFKRLILSCFKEGLEQIQVFKRWSKHTDMRAYANVLEEWDDKVGDNWDEPDSEYLNPFSWISEDDWYTN